MTTTDWITDMGTDQRRLVKNRAARGERELLLERARFLPELSRLLVEAHFDRGLKIRELALLHNMSPRQMRRRIDRLREMLADPCFLLASQYGEKLPPSLQPVVRGYWVEGKSLRELAAALRMTLHRTRQDVMVSRSWLMAVMAGKLSMRAAPD